MTFHQQFYNTVNFPLVYPDLTAIKGFLKLADTESLEKKSIKQLQKPTKY